MAPPTRTTAAPMDHQLVIKFWRASLADDTFLATLEDTLRPLLGADSHTDGIDTHPKEINLFVVTPDPRQAFRRIRPVLEAAGVVNGVSAAYRVVGGARFTSVWPLRPMRKFTLP